MAAARVLIIANPAARTVTPALVWEVVRVSRRQAHHVSVHWTTAPGDATRIAMRAAESSPALPLTDRALTVPTLVSHPSATSPRTVVVVVGGDGTVREVAAGLASAWGGAAPTPLLVVPTGTAQSCYRTLFGAAPWQSTLETALRSPDVRWLDLARVAGRLMLAGTSAGPFPGQVTIDGRLVHSGLTTRVDVTPAGQLDVRVLSPTGTVHERGHQVRIERTDGQPLRFEHDGEALPLGPEHYTVTLEPAAVPVPVTPSVIAAAA